jgi:hypothetical protein
MSISYTSEQSVTEAVRASISGDPALQSRDWWCESVNFFDNPNTPGRLSGDTKLMLIGYSTASGEHVEVETWHNLGSGGLGRRTLGRGGPRHS